MKAVTDTKYYDDIAQRIQTYGDDKRYTPSEMASAIDGIVADAVQRGENDGYQKGYADGEAQGLIDGNVQGRQEQHKEFWDNITSNNTRTSYRYAFAGVCWDDNNFNPPYQLKPKDARYMFYGYNRITKLYKSQVDFSQATNMEQVFAYYGALEYIEELNLASATTIYRLFRYADNLTTIDKLILKSDGTEFDNQTFYSCSNLAEINEIEGCMDGIDVSFLYCPNLTETTIDNIISALKTLTDEDEARTVTFHATTKSNMTDAQKAKITTKGWTLA